MESYGTQPLHVLSVNLGLQLSGGPICKQCARKKWRRRRRGFSCFMGPCSWRYLYFEEPSAILGYHGLLSSRLAVNR